MANDTQRPQNPDPKTNHLLARLDPGDYIALIEEASIVSLKFGKRVFRQDDNVDSVYFPLNCMFSLLVSDGDKAQLELATIGSEGVAGASEVLHTQGAIGLHIVQLPGFALRIGANAFLKVANARPLIQR